ncbi:MAG: type II methionyl aminopeptidase [Thaumarchaeota archaeon]|nr:type II methionyl aminopeptidase [Nitrososphaerota archaeon]
MSDKELEEFRQAGQIARRVREKASALVREGVRVFELCEEVEEAIRSEGAEPAFPCNVGINEVAAHYPSPPGDELRIPPRSIVKIDLGVCLNGYIADTAVTIALAPDLEPLAEASRIALREAIKAMRAGVPVSRIGLIVQETANRLGFKPIRNLTGHEIKRYELHAGTTIPNIGAPCPGRLQEGHVYAVEPFLTTMKGAGEVVSTRLRTIFRVEPGKVKLRKLKGEERELINLLINRFKGMPYTLRWIKDLDKLRGFHERLVKNGRIYSYPVLVERFGEPVSQSEHTVIVFEDGCEVIT